MKKMERVKRIFLSKYMTFVVVMAVMTSALCMTALCAEGDEVVGTMTTAFTTIQGTMLSGIAAIAPIGLVVAGAVLLWKFGVRFFKSLAK